MTPEDMRRVVDETLKDAGVAEAVRLDVGLRLVIALGEELLRDMDRAMFADVVKGEFGDEPA